jgi:hypothetical protein
MKMNCFMVVCLAAMSIAACSDIDAHALMVDSNLDETIVCDAFFSSVCDPKQRSTQVFDLKNLFCLIQNHQDVDDEKFGRLRRFFNVQASKASSQDPYTARQGFKYGRR